MRQFQQLICGGLGSAMYGVGLLRLSCKMQAGSLSRLSTARCATYFKHGRPSEVLQVVTRELAALKDEEVRMAVLAAPVNPSDVVQIQGRYGIQPELPAVAGNEGIGRVVEVGKKVTNVKVGDIAALPAGAGTWRSQLNIAGGAVFPIKGCTDFLQLAMARTTPPTAFLLLTKHKNLERGDWVIQSAANSAVGHCVIQLAKAGGFKTVNVVRSESSAEQVRKKGGDVVVVDGEDLASRIAEATGNASITLALDAVGGAHANRLADALAPGGVIVNYGALSGQPVQLSSTHLIFKNIKVKGFWVEQWLNGQSAEDTRVTTRRFIKLLEIGEFSTDIDSTYSLDKIDDAINCARSLNRRGKVMLLPNEPPRVNVFCCMGG